MAQRIGRAPFGCPMLIRRAILRSMVFHAGLKLFVFIRELTIVLDRFALPRRTLLDDPS